MKQSLSNNKKPSKQDKVLKIQKSKACQPITVNDLCSQVWQWKVDVIIFKMMYTIVYWWFLLHNDSAHELIFHRKNQTSFGIYNVQINNLTHQSMIVKFLTTQLFLINSFKRSKGYFNFLKKKKKWSCFLKKIINKRNGEYFRLTLLLPCFFFFVWFLP